MSSATGEVGVVDDSVAATVSAKDKEFDDLLASPLPVPQAPTSEGEETRAPDAGIKEYRANLYNYYIQYYARFYMEQLRSVYRQYNPSSMFPAALSTLPEPSAPADDLDLSGITNSDQLDALYKQLHFTFNFQASQVYQKWFADQNAWIIQTATQPKQQPTEPLAYTAKAYFNAKTQRFQAQTSEEHWASQGLSLDREGRQMAAFFDVEAYQESQRNYKKKKQPKQSAKYWKKKKEERKRQKLLEFVKDDDY